METKDWQSPQVFLTPLHFFRPFVSVPHARLTVLAGEAFSAVSRPGKLYNDRARGIRNLSDRVLSLDDMIQKNMVFLMNLMIVQ